MYSRNGVLRKITIVFISFIFFNFLNFQKLSICETK